MFREELSDTEISVLLERIALAADHPELTCHEAEAIASVQVRLRRYGTSLFLSWGERHRLYRIFDKAGCLPRFGVHKLRRARPSSPRDEGGAVAT